MGVNESISVTHQGLSHVHATITLIPGYGKNKGQGKRITTADTIDYSNNGSHTYLPGSQYAPITVAPGKCEPTWDFNLAKREWQEVIEHVGSGYLLIPFRLVVVWKLPTHPAQKDVVHLCMIEKDGVKSKHGDHTMVNCAGKARACIFNGVDPFTVPLTG